MVKVCIDPGHGGSDPGACSNGLQEKDITLIIGGKVAYYLKLAGFGIVMTRCIDEDVAYPNASATDELQARCDISNSYGADIFVSIHCNSFCNPAANGTETIYCGGSLKGASLACYVQSQIVGLGGLTDRGVKDDPLYVTKNTDAVAALVEVAFISNPEDATKLGNPKWQDEFAKAIARGVTDYLSEK